MGVGRVRARGRPPPASTACSRSICRSKRRASFARRWRRPGIDTIFLLSPTTTDARIRKAAALGRGFLYGISRLGVTGARDRVAAGAEALVQRIRAHTTLPIALGFGISRPEHVAEVGAYADAAVVGSALVSLIAEASGLAGARATGRGLRAVAEGRAAAPARARRTASHDHATLDDLRQDIDRVDEVLVRLLNERARCVCEIGRLKKEQGIEIYQPDREKEVLEHVRSSRVRGPARPGRDRPAVRADHRRGAAAGTPRRARREHEP